MATSKFGLLRWLALAVGLGCAALGVVLVLRPFTSLSVLVALVGVGLITSGVTILLTGIRPLTIAAGGAWIATGVLVLVWPDISTRALATVVGLALILGGVLDVVAGLRGSTDERLAAVLRGVASVIFGVLALTWPDVTVLVIAVVFGARLIIVGLSLAWSALRGHDPSAAGVERGDREPPGRIRRIGHVVVAAASLVLALALGGLSNRLNEAEAVVDSFYDPPDDVPAEPGMLLRAEAFTRAIPDGAEAWRILYTTTRADDVPAVASAIVVAPTTPADAPPPVIAWAHGTTGVNRRCAPSVLPDPWVAGAFFSLDRVVEQGWALVATDYVGLGSPAPHPYLVGEPAGRSVLDAVRAARQLDDVALSEQTVVWGHSQGGGAALWTGVIAPSYAPDVPLDGVAALAPASDLPGLMENLGVITGGSIFASFVVRGYADAYPDVRIEDYVRPAGRTTFDETANRCLDGSTLVSVLSSAATGMSMFTDDLQQGALATRLEENIPDGPIEAPLLVGQGAADRLVLPDVQARYVETRCAAGYPVDFRTYEGLDHVPLVEPDSPLIPELIEWTTARLAGEAPTPTCGAG